MSKQEEWGGGSHVAPKSKYRPVENFFPVSVDDFFDDPNIIVNYAKSLHKMPVSTGRWPGTRSELLWKIDKELNDAIVMKLLSCYYDFNYQDISWQSAQLSFQEIPMRSKTKNDVRNKGWIHLDNYGLKEEVAQEVAGLIYLTPDIDPDSGTSLFNLKPRNDKEYDINQTYFAKKLVHTNKNISGGPVQENDTEEFDVAYFTKIYKEHEDQFIEKIRFANIYNRMIMYDTNEFHRANSWYNGDGKDARLTLVFFIGGLTVGSYPLEQLKGRDYDEVIKYRSVPRPL